MEKRAHSLSSIYWLNEKRREIVNCRGSLQEKVEEDQDEQFQCLLKLSSQEELLLRTTTNVAAIIVHKKPEVEEDLDLELGIIMPKKKTNPEMEVEDDDELEEPLPDIRSQGEPFLMRNPKDVGAFIKGVKLVGVLLTFIVGIGVIPILAGLVVLLILLPRVVVQLVIWFKLRSEGIHMLTVSQAFKAAGYEFYTIVFVLRGECKLGKIREKFQTLLDAEIRNGSKELKYPELRRRLTKIFGFFCYQEKKSIELRNHVRYLEDDTALLTQIQLYRILQSDFEFGNFKGAGTDSPQWEALVVPEFMYDRDIDEEDGLMAFGEFDRGDSDKSDKFYAIAFRANSATLDKQTALKMFKEGIVDAKDSEMEHASHSRRGRFGKLDKLFIYLYSIVLTPWVFFTWMLQGIPRTFGMPKHDEYRRGSFDSEPFVLTNTRSMNMGAVQAAKNVSKTTVTSIIAYCTAGCARNMILGQNKQLPGEYRLMVKQFSRNLDGNESTFKFTLDAATYSYPLDRLSDAFYTVSGSRNDEFLVEAKKLVNSLLFWVAGATSASTGTRFYKRLLNVHITLEIWDIGGPFKIFGGDVLADVFAWNAISGTCADFGVTVTTYAGRMKANFIGDNEVLGFDTKVRRKVLPEEFIEEFVNICQPSDIKPKYLFRPAAVGKQEL